MNYLTAAMSDIHTYLITFPSNYDASSFMSIQIMCEAPRVA